MTINGTNCVLVMMDPKLKRRLRRVAAAHGLSMSEFVRVSVRNQIRRAKESRGDPG
jgi:plasmid stability protein